MNLRYILSFLNIMKIPGLYPIMKDWRAFIRMHFIFSAHESGLLKALSTPSNRDMLIKELNVKRPEVLDALLEVGLASKELELNNGLFSIKGKRSKAIMESNGDMLAAMIQGNVTYYSDAYRNVTNRIHGGELGDDLDKIGDLVARFSKIAEPIIKNFISSIVHGKNPMRILDIGCGSGVLLKSAYDSNGNATGVGIDIDEKVVRQAGENISTWGLSDRFEIRHGDIRHISGEMGTFDVITLYNLLYYFDKEARLSLINNLRDMLLPTGVLAVAMSFHSKGKDMATANLNMVNSSLKGLTPLPQLDDITSVLKKCGFGKIEIHRFMPGSTFYGIVATQN
ncbi:class I SAM-dependent methyltransferase [uncultured Desulfuromusa sp.]|uniref:class I SAM-dependent methyltransferase n=1 Tax=uncultured Desulfuromusa sp. TaxID=219183 RepID=UPI002AA69268|nr:class I SAM-dependent methyltransferase [uncultured Desulfuromusa sp.]